MRDRRYNLTIPEGYLGQMTKLAQDEHTEVSDIIRRFVTIGLIVAATERRGGNLVIRLDGKEEALVAFPATKLTLLEAPHA